MKLEKEKTIKYSDLISNYFYQQIAFYVTNIIYKSRITPNQITYLSIAFGFLSALFIIEQKFYMAVLFLNISFILDCVDGQLARVKKLQSDFGMWLDNMADRLVENLVLLSMGFIYLNDNKFLFFLLFLVFFNMYYAYITDMMIYANKTSHKRLSKIEKILFMPIYFISRSMIIPVLSLFILYPKKMVIVILFLYVYGIVFRIYREISK